MGQKSTKKKGKMTKQDMEWAMRVRIVENLTLSRFCNEAALKKFQKETGYPVTPALMIKMDEEQSILIMSPLTPPKVKERSSMVLSTGTVSEQELTKQIKRLQKEIKKA